jgi:hypothetical protein
VDGPTDWKGMLPNHCVPQDPRTPSITLAHVIDDGFELVSGGGSSADVIPGHEDSPDLYPVWSPTELGKALIREGRKMVSLTQPDSGLN